VPTSAFESYERDAQHVTQSSAGEDETPLGKPLGSWLFVSALALVLFQFLSRIELRAADHALV